MGTIKRFNLKRLMLQNGATVFLETGTWKGDGLAYAAKQPFKKLYSSEIIDSIAQKAKDRFAHDSRIRIVAGSSTSALQTLLAEIDGNCIFWLDAHYPGAEEGLKDYNEVQDEVIKLPLQKELEIISARNQRYQDIIVVDDLRIYEVGEFKNGNLPDSVIPPPVRNTNFVNQLFAATHTILKFYEDEGYLVLVPKNVSGLTPFKSAYITLYNKLSGKLL